MADEKKVPVGKPSGMSDKAWVKLHQVIAKIYVNHAEEIQEMTRKKEAVV